MRSEARTTTSTRWSGRTRWLGVFVGLFLIFGAWAFAAPYDGPPDEHQHAIRAVGVVSGQLAPKPAAIPDGLGNPGIGAYQQVPRGLDDAASCWGRDPRVPATCQPQISGGPVESVPTTAGRYNPLYYAMVGLPLKIAPNWAGLVIARLLSAALSAALLASAFMVLRRWSRYGLMLAGMLISVTPMLAHLAGSVNPNSLEIAAGITLFSTGIPLLLGPVRGDRRPLMWLFGISAVLLANLRSFGPVWLVFALLALLLPESRRTLGQWWARRRELRRAHRGVLVLAGVVAVSLLASAAWIVGVGAGNVVASAAQAHYTLPNAVFTYFRFWGSLYPQGMIGVAGWFDIWMPSPFYLVWMSAMAGLVLFGFIAGTRADRLRFLILAIGVVVVPGIAQVAEVNTVGFIIGGRYMLPLAAGIPLLAAFIVEQRMVTAAQSRSINRLFLVLLLPAHFVLLIFAMTRWQSGLHGNRLNPLGGPWHPATGSVLPIVVMLAGILVTGVIFWRSAGDTAAAPDPAPVRLGEPMVNDLLAGAPEISAPLTATVGGVGGPGIHALELAGGPGGRDIATGVTGSPAR